MRYNDLILNEGIDSVVEEIRNSLWFKNSNYDLFRGISPLDSNYKKVNIRKDRKRVPKDTALERHNVVNELSISKLGYPIRNGLFITADYYQALKYNDLVGIIFPIGDDYKMFSHPTVYDYYGSHISNDSYVDKIEEISKTYTSKPSGEIMFFGNAYILPLSVAAQYNLLKSKGFEEYDLKELLNIIDTGSLSDVMRYVYENYHEMENKITPKNAKIVLKNAIERFGHNSKNIHDIIRIFESALLPLQDIVGILDDKQIIALIKNPRLTNNLEIFNSIKNKELLKKIPKSNLYINTYIGYKEYKTIELLCKMHFDKIEFVKYILCDFISNMKRKYGERIYNMIPSVIEYAKEKLSPSRLEDALR